MKSGELFTSYIPKNLFIVKITSNANNVNRLKSSSRRSFVKDPSYESRRKFVLKIKKKEEKQK